jgi:energy-converting hydrogenase Eha subunit B
MAAGAVGAAALAALGERNALDRELYLVGRRLALEQVRGFAHSRRSKSSWWRAS